MSNIIDFEYEEINRDLMNNHSHAVFIYPMEVVSS